MSPRVVILTGAGISAESGLGTFRDLGGLWTQVRLEDVATPEAFARDPDGVRDFYNARRRNCIEAAPNSAHDALAALEDRLGDDLLIVTQNVDDLHERAGSRRVIHMHGELLRGLCPACGARFDQRADQTSDSACPDCGATGVRPDVVWFGEYPYQMDRITAALAGCALFAAIGTSGAVYPAAGFVQEAAAAGARTVEITLERGQVSDLFDEVILGKASETAPRWAASV